MKVMRKNVYEGEGIIGRNIYMEGFCVVSGLSKVYFNFKCGVS